MFHVLYTKDRCAKKKDISYEIKNIANPPV